MKRTGENSVVAVIVISNPHPRREIDPAFPVKDV
jgi:hypothetical protein